VRTPSPSQWLHALHHNGFDDDGAEGARRAHIAIRTYLSTGIRLAFSPGVRDESKLAMGGEEFIETLPPDLRYLARAAFCRSQFGKRPGPPLVLPPLDLTPRQWEP